MAERFSVPLVMLPHNIKAMLDAKEKGETIPCQGVCLKRDPNSSEGVLLVFNMTEEQKAYSLKNFGFKTGKEVEQ